MLDATGLAILVPSKGRPARLKRMIESTRGLAQIYLAISKEEKPIYAEFLNVPNIIVFLVPDLMPTAYKWNILADYAMKDSRNFLFMLGADDMIFDNMAWLQHTIADKIQVYALQDSRDKDGTPHPIMTRKYIDRMGWFVPPIFLHWQIDTWTRKIAEYAGCFTHLRDYKLIHEKSNDAGNPDATHTAIRERGWRERDSYVARTCGEMLRLWGQKLRGEV